MVALIDDPEAVFQALVNKGSASGDTFSQHALIVGTQLYTDRNIQSQQTTGKALIDRPKTEQLTVGVPVNQTIQQVVPVATNTTNVTTVDNTGSVSSWLTNNGMMIGAAALVAFLVLRKS